MLVAKQDRDGYSQYSATRTGPLVAKLCGGALGKCVVQRSVHCSLFPEQGLGNLVLVCVCVAEKAGSLGQLAHTAKKLQLLGIAAGVVMMPSLSGNMTLTDSAMCTCR